MNFAGEQMELAKLRKTLTIFSLLFGAPSLEVIGDWF